MSGVQATPESSPTTGDRPDPQRRDSSAIAEIFQFAGILRRRWIPALLAAVGIFAGIVTLGLVQPRLYRATATLHVGARTPNVLHDVNDVYSLGTLHPFEFPRYMDTQAKVIRGREVAGEVVERLDLASDLDFLGIEPDLPPERLAAELALVDPVRVLQERVLTEQVEESNLLRVVCDDPDPQRATAIVNAFADVFILRNSEMREVATESAVVWLKAQVAEAEARVAETEADLLVFREENTFLGATVDDAMQISAATLEDVNTRVTALKLERVSKQARWGGSHASSARALPEVVGDPQVRQIRTEILQIRRERANLSARYGNKHPSISDLDVPEQELRDLLDAEMETLVASEREGILALAREEKAVMASLSEEQQHAYELHRMQIEYGRLERQLEQRSELLEMLQGRFQEARLAEQLRTNNISVVEYSPVPSRHFKPRLPFVGAVALTLAAILALTLAVVLDRLDSKIRTQAQVERELGLRVLGIQPIPRVKQVKGEPDADGKREKVTPKVELLSALAPKSYFAECLRTIRTNISFTATEKRNRTVLVTSAVGSEGKTTFSTNLALTFAAMGKRTLLIDTDLRLPRVATVFGVEDHDGLLVEVLLGEKDLAKSLVETRFPNLHLLVCGKPPSNPAELLGSHQFQALHASLARRFDRIVFDSPPTVPVTDAKLLCPYADDVVLVIRQDTSDRHAVQHALRQLRDVDAPLAGCVFNGADARGVGYGYGYGYRYG